MANDFWNNLVTLARRTNARAEAVNSIFAAIKSGFDLFPSKARMYENRVNLCVDTGAANAYVLTPIYAVTLTNGARVTFQVLTTNSGPSVANVYALGNLPVLNFAGLALGGGELLSSAFVELIYDSTLNSWRIAAPLVAVGSVSVTNNFKNSLTDTTPGTFEAKTAVLGQIVRRRLASGGNEVSQFKLTTAGGTAAIATFTAVVGQWHDFDSTAGILTVNLPLIGAGDTLLQDGDIVTLRDVGGSVETNNVTVSGNGNNIAFMGQAAAASITVNNNYVEMTFVWKAAATQWQGFGFYY